MGSEKVLIGRQGILDSGPCEITVTIKGETQVVEGKLESTILDTLLEKKLSPPFSCMTGSCTACMAKVTDGKVFQEILAGLPEHSHVQDYALTCQARPLTPKISIEY